MIHRLVIGLTFLITALGAQAVPLTETISFSLGGFADAFGSAPPPFSTLNASITVTFDPGVTYENDVTDITVNYLTGGFVSGSALGFSYGSSSHRLRFGGIQNSAETTYGGTDDFTVAFDLTDIARPVFVTCDTTGYSCGRFTGDANYTVSAYAQTRSPASIWEATTARSSVTVVATPPVSAVPEPETYALMLAGLVALGFTNRRRSDLKSVQETN